MKLSLQLENGYLSDKYGKFAGKADKYKEQPVISFPIEISEIPKNAKFLALSLVDYDAIPVCGFPWIHWLAADIPLKGTELLIPENASVARFEEMIQGKNSNASPFVGETDEKIIHRYTGPTPPDADHTYTLSISALSEKLDLQEGFWWNELQKAAQGKEIESAEITFVSRAGGQMI